MRIESIRHKGLRQLYEDDSSRGVQPSIAEKLRKMLLAIESASSLESLLAIPGWKLHSLKGVLNDHWSLTVTANWRLIFEYQESTNTARILDLVDYH